MRRALLLSLLALGLVARVAGLRLWGTFDTEVQKAWSARAAEHGLADIYGPSDAELVRGLRGSSLPSALFGERLPRTRFEWGSASYFVDYPPGSILVLWAAGHLYGLAHPDFPNTPAFNAAINLAPFLASLAVAWLLWRSAPGALGERRALWFWLNPAVLLAVPVLGYQDTVFGALALAAVLDLMAGRHARATAWVVAAGLVKPQGALLLPTLAAVLLREAAPRRWLAAAGAGLATAALILAPWWLSGHLVSALDGCLRPLHQQTLAPLGLNVWWIAGWAMDAAREGPRVLARILSIRELGAWAGFDPRAVARALLGAATALNLVLLLRAPRADRAAIPLSVALQVHAYTLLATSVHENHSFLAVLLLPLLLGARRGARLFLGASSAYLFLSLFCAAGFGRRVTKLAQVASLRAASGIDLSVLVAALSVPLVVALFVWAAGRRPLPPRGEAAA